MNTAPNHDSQTEVYEPERATDDETVAEARARLEARRNVTSGPSHRDGAGAAPTHIGRIRLELPGFAEAANAGRHGELRTCRIESCATPLGPTELLLCIKCLGTPEERAQRRERSELERREKDRRSAEELWIRRVTAVLAEVPSRHRDIALDTSQIVGRVRRSEAIDEVRSLVGAPMILLVGPAGCGKSTLAGAIVGTVVRAAKAGDRAMQRLAIGALWTSAPELARSRQAHRLGEESPLVTRAIEAPFMVLDDLGMERRDPDGSIAEILYLRAGAELPTIVTTGFPRAELAARYGDGIARRLAEVGAAHVIRCDLLRAA